MSEGSEESNYYHTNGFFIPDPAVIRRKGSTDNSHSTDELQPPNLNLLQPTRSMPLKSHKEFNIDTSFSEPILEFTGQHDSGSKVVQFPPFQSDLPTCQPHVCVWEHLSREDMDFLFKLHCEKDDVINFLRMINYFNLKTKIKHILI